MTYDNDNTESLPNGNGDHTTAPGDGPGHQLKFEDTVRLQAGQTSLWSVLSDPATLSTCLPGVEAMTETTDGVYTCSITQSITGITHLTLSMDGEFEVTASDEPTSAVFRGTAHDPGTSSELSIVGAIQVDAVDATTVDVAYLAEVSLRSSNASLSPDVLKPTISDSIEKAFDNIQTAVQELADEPN